MTVIPAIDIMDGRAVRLSKGDFETRKVYSERPEELAKLFSDAGFSRLHVVDLDGAKSGRPVNLGTVEKIARSFGGEIDLGGGIKQRADAIAAFGAGAAYINAGTVAVKNAEEAEEWIKEFGAGKIILSADVKDGKIAVKGWLEDTVLPVEDFVSAWFKKGVTTAVSTDISRDGMLSGPALNLYRSISKAVPGVKLIASGGISGAEDLKALKAEGLYGAIVGKAFYEGRMTLKEMKEAE